VWEDGRERAGCAGRERRKGDLPLLGQQAVRWAEPVLRACAIKGMYIKRNREYWLNFLFDLIN